jgi:multidrug transporter EmrE-like cation transporter
MKEPLIALIAVICNVGAQLAMKYAGREQEVGKTLAAWLSPWLLSAVVLYGLSFLLTVRVYAANPLSVASPTMAGCTFLLIALTSWLVLGEGLGYQKLAGIGLIFIGIAVLTRS